MAGAAVLLAAGPLVGPAPAVSSPVQGESAPHCALAGPDLDVSWPRPAERSPGGGKSREAPLHEVADLPLPGSASRFDYQSVDPGLRRLYIAHMGAGALVVFNLAAGRVTATVSGLPRVTGVLAVPAEHRVYVSVTGQHRLAAIDATSLRPVASVPGIRFPDGIAYVAGVRRLFVSDESGRRDVVIDAATNTAVERIALGGEAGNTRYDPGSGCVLVAVQTADRLAVIDPTSLRIVRQIRLHGIAYPHGLLVDAERRLLFVAGAGNATLGILDADSFSPLGNAPLGDDPDVLALDPEGGRIYVASESGVVSIFDIRGRAVTPAGTLVAPNAHSVAVDPESHRVYLPLANFGGRPVLRIFEPVSGPPEKAGHPSAAENGAPAASMGLHSSVGRSPSGNPRH